MKKAIVGLLGLSLVIMSSVPAYGMVGRLGSRFSTRFTAAASMSRQFGQRISRFAQSTKPYVYSRPALFGMGLSTGAGVTYWQNQQAQKQLRNEIQDMNKKIESKFTDQIKKVDEKVSELNCRVYNKEQSKESSLESSLIVAYWKGDTQTVKTLLRMGVNPDFISINKYHCTVEELIEKGVITGYTCCDAASLTRSKLQMLHEYYESDSILGKAGWTLAYYLLSVYR